MLVECENPYQKQDEGPRRIFSDRFLDVYVWYNKKIEHIIIGFQICYNKNIDERAFTWRKEYRFDHKRVESKRWLQTPILVGDGFFNKGTILKKFLESSKNIDQAIVEFIYNKLIEYN